MMTLPEDETVSDTIPAPPSGGGDVPRMDEAALREFVLGCCDGHIFTSAQVESEHELPMVFMLIGLGGLQNVNVSQLGIVWEHLSKAGPRSINGLPMFFSLHLMHKDDWAIALPAIRAELERRQTLPILTPESP